MILSDLSIKRPVFATVMMLILVTLGIFSYRRLAIDMFPDVEIPVITLTTIYPGAAPETVEREVTKRIEEAVNPIPGVKHVESSSREGVSLVVVEFQLEVRINDASQEARAKVNAIRGDLPQAIQEPIIQKLDFAAAPICSLAVRSQTMAPQALTKLVEKKIQRRLESLPGVGKADLIGESKREVQVEIMPERLESLGMGVDEVIFGLQSENVNIPMGRLKRGGSEYSIRLSGKPEEVSQFGGMMVANRNGRPIKLAEVARVIDSIQEQRSLALINGVPAVAVDIMKQSGANTVGVVDSVKKEIDKLKPEMPAGTTIDLVRDGSLMIRESVRDVQETLVMGGILTIFIVFLFLNSWRSTVITGLTLPISVISSFIVMNFMGMTLNMMTLMALSLAIGLLIDDAIVVRENIVRHLERGQDHYTAAQQGTSEIGLAVMATTFSIIAVFVPVAFMKGIVGRFFYHFGITVAFAVLVSLFVSFTLDPMLSSIWHDPDIERKGKRRLLNRALDLFNSWFDRSADGYRYVIGWALDHRKTILLLATLAFFGGLFIFSTLESTFMEQWDQGEFLLNFKTSPEASIEETKGRINTVLAELNGFPEVASTYATIGAGDWGTVRDASIYIKLVDRNQRTRNQFEIQRATRSMLARIPGITPFLMQAGNLDNRKEVQVSVQGEELALLKKYGAELKSKVYGIRGLVDLDVTLEQDIPEFKFTVDREHAADRGVMSTDVVRTVAALIGGQAATTFEDEDGDAVNLRVRLPESLRQDPSQVGALRLAQNRFGQPPALLPLGDLVSYKLSNTPSEITRRDLSREVVLSANTDQLPLASAVQKIGEAAADIKMEPGYRLVFKGQNEEMTESFGYMGEALLLAIIFVYLILAAQFESFIDPLSIMLSLPLAIVGMAGMLKLTGDTVNIMSLIGLIMLMGLVTKNAILLVDFAKTMQRSGMARREAVITAGRTRLRPIMMTTLAMIFGMLPLVFALGAGAEMRAPMARAIVGGLITSTFLTLLVVPVVYTLLDDLAAWLFRRRKTAAKSAAPALVGVLLCLVCLSGIPLQAEEKPVRMLTLPEALSLAAEQNKDIQKAREVKNKVMGRYIEERASALPRLTLSSSTAKAGDASQRAFGGGFFKDMPTSQYSYGMESQVEQVLYSWGQVGAAIRAAKEGLADADDQLRIYQQAVARDLSVAFYDVLMAKEMLQISRSNLEQRQRHLEEARKKYDSGTATDYDVLAGEVEVQNSRPGVIRSENLIRTAQERLRFLIGLEDQPVDALGELSAPVGGYPSFELILEQAIKNRPDLQELEHQENITKELVRIYSAGNKPRLDFRSGIGYRHMDIGMGHEGGLAYQAGVYMTFPAWDGGRAKGKVMQAQSDLTTLQIQRAQLADTISLQVREAIYAVKEAGEVVQALAGTVTQAEKLLFMAEKGYEYGVKTKLDVDDAQLNLLQAKTNLAKARRDYLAARVSLEWVSGSITL